MPLDTRRVFEARNAAQYTGTNAADFNTEISDFTVVSENAAGLTFTSGGQQYTVAPNGYIAWYGNAVTEVFQNEDDYGDAYAEVDTEAAMNHVHHIVTSTGYAATSNGNGTV